MEWTVYADNGSQQTAVGYVTSEGEVYREYEGAADPPTRVGWVTPNGEVHRAIGDDERIVGYVLETGVLYGGSGPFQTRAGWISRGGEVFGHADTSAPRVGAVEGTRYLGTIVAGGAAVLLLLHPPEQG
ncbi:MAG TPA: hypothetical protein VGS80_02700 [Ktedonobacterales bacterium]|nr:hypothetical protein [Ktedonobacterales bacterium]